MHLFDLNCCPRPIYVYCYPISPCCYPYYRHRDEVSYHRQQEEVSYRQRVEGIYEQTQIYYGHEHGKG